VTVRHALSLCLLAIVLTFGAGVRAETPALGPQTQIVRVRSGDTLMTLLVRSGVSAPDAQEAVRALQRLWNPRELQVDQEIALDFGSTRLEAVQLFAGLDRTVRAVRNLNGHFTPISQARELARVPHLSVGVIKTSLYEAAMEAGVPPTVLSELTRAFSYDVDFQRDVQPGDGFEVLFERITDPHGAVIANGDIVYASMTLSGQRLRLYRHATNGTDAADFFNAQGQSVKKALLKTPIDGARLTSGFGLRMHPILGYTAMHRGVDFGAAEGTPIMAAGDGVVERAARDPGYGNLVLLRHNGTYETAYAHMSRFAASTRPGAHVRQGQIIGYVGATGRATGPHLHYEVRVNQTQVNPLSIKMESGRKLAGGELRAFRAVADEIDRQLLSLRQDTLIAAARN
jgi:murein DD-endopeptidase MepM/ murein hydrolase activator NlpD